MSLSEEEMMEEILLVGAPEEVEVVGLNCREAVGEENMIDTTWCGGLWEWL